MLPIRFTYVSREHKGQKVYVSILQQFNHHFTGNAIFRVRLEGESGWFDEGLYPMVTILEWLQTKVEVAE